MRRLTAFATSSGAIALARSLAALTIVCWLLPSAHRVPWGPAVFVAMLAAAAVALAGASMRLRGTARVLFASLGAAAGIALTGATGWALGRSTYDTPLAGGAISVAAQAVVMLGLAIALARHRHRNWMRFEAVVDALLLVAAAAIVMVQLGTMPGEGDALPALRALARSRHVLDAGMLILLALLLAWRGEALGERLAGWLALGTVSLVLGDVLLTRALLAGGGVPRWSVLLWSAAVMAWVSAGRLPQRLLMRQSGESPRFAQHTAHVRIASIVLAIIIAGLNAALAAGSGVRSAPLAAAIAVFALMVAARTGVALWIQHRAAQGLEDRVTAERELSTTLELRVQSRTTELAQAKRALQRMWALGQQIALELRADRVLKRYLEAVIDVVRADGGAVALRGEDGRLHVVGTAGREAAPGGDTLAAATAAMEQVVQTGIAWHLGAALRSDEGSPAALALAASGMRGGAIFPVQRRAERIGAVMVTTRAAAVFTEQDVANVEAMTDLLSVALANAELVETMRKAEWRFRTLFRVAPDAVFTVLESGRVREANDAVRDVLGIPPVQAVGRTIDEFVMPEDQDRVRSDLARALGGAAVRSELRFRHPAGVRIVSLAARAMPEADPPTVLFVGRDVTTEREMRSRLAETERLAAVGELVAGVAHEVNNPLSTISAFAQLLLRDEPLSAEQRESVEVIHAETQRASQVMRDLLTFARRSEREPEPLALNEVVERTVRLRSYDMDAQRITCRLDLDPELPAVTGDARQLQQVVLNLVTNAVQAMSQNGGTLHLVTRAERDRAVLEVRDTGSGIPPEIRIHIFEPFFTTKRDGTGLGLSVSYGIVTAHGGMITVADTGPGGTTFRVSLPVPEEPAEEAPHDAPRALVAPSPLAGIRLLFVDDEPSLRRGVQSFGRMRRFEVVTAEDGATALDQARHGGFDAIVCDLRMPVMDGPAFYEVLRREDPAMAARTIFITGDLVNVASRGFLGTVPQPVLSKPFELEQLEEMIEGLLRADRGGGPASVGTEREGRGVHEP